MKVKNMVSTNASDGVFNTIGGSFDARLLFGVPLYRGIVQNMDNSSLRYSRSQVRHEVSIKKTVIRTGFYIGGGHECGSSSGSTAYKSPQFPSIVLKFS